MDTINIPSIDVSAVKQAEKETQLIIKEAQGVVIKTQNDYLSAGELRRKIKGRIKELDEKRKSLTAPLDVCKRNIMAMFNPIIERLEQGIKNLDAGVIAYDEAQQEKAQIAQARADEEARKAREKAEARAKELEAQGKTEKAQVMQDKADNIIAPIITASAPKIAGQSIREMWYAEVIDFKTLSDDYKLPNQQALDKIAQSTQGKISITGVKFYSKKIVSGRSM